MRTQLNNKMIFVLLSDLENQYITLSNKYERLFSIYAPYRMHHKYSAEKQRLKTIVSDIMLFQLALESQ